MSDIYNSCLPKFCALFSGVWLPKRWAVTWGQTTLWTVDKGEIHPAWRRHEDCHKQQFAQDGKLRFLLRYVWEWFCGLVRYRSFSQAYSHISYEQEAVAAEMGGKDVVN